MEEKKAQLIEEIETTLFYSEDLNKFIFEGVEDLQEFSFAEFVDFVEWKTSNGTEQADFLKWELIKNFCSIKELNKANFEEIKKEFLKEIKNCFDLVGG